jgi:hypothetical protein
MEQISGVAGGVPYLALPLRVRPTTRRWRWPGTCTTRRAARPRWRARAAERAAGLAGVPRAAAERQPPARGGPEAFFQLSYQGAVLKVFEPTCRQAVEEFPPAAGRPPPGAAAWRRAAGAFGWLGRCAGRAGCARRDGPAGGCGGAGQPGDPARGRGRRAGVRAGPGTGCRVGLAGDPRRGDCGAGAAGLFTVGSRPSSGGIGSIGAARISTHGLMITPRSAS